MEAQRNAIVPKKKTFWKMVKTMFLPAQTIANLMVGCGGKRSRAKRRLSIKNMQTAKDAFIRASFRRARQENNGRRQSRSVESESNTQTMGIEVASGEILSSEMVSNESQGPIDFSNASQNSTPPVQRVPLTLEQAQSLLESLTLCGRSSTSSGTSTTEQTVNPDISNQNQSNETEGYMQQVTVNVEVVNEADPNPNTQINEERNSTDYQSQSPAGPEVSSTTQVSTGQESHEVVLRRSRMSSTVSNSTNAEFHGWRRSSVEVSSNPPVTLAYIPSGLCVGDRIVWVKDDHPEIGTVRWIGKIRNQFYSGIEFDKPVGNSSGIYGYGVGLFKRLFTCELAYGRFVPVKELVLYKDYHDTGVKSGIVCVVCRDDFLDTWDPDIFLDNTLSYDDSELQAFNMVSTKCGHLYHWGCLNHWFSTKKRNEYHCPMCSKPMEREDVIRIFPSQI